MHETLTYHKQKVNDMIFFQRGYSHLLISGSVDGTIGIYSLNDHQLIFRHNVGQSIERVIFNPQVDEVMYVTADMRLHICAMSDNSMEDSQKGGSVQYNLMKHFMNADEDQQVAAIRFID